MVRKLSPVALVICLLVFTQTFEVATQGQHRAARRLGLSDAKARPGLAADASRALRLKVASRTAVYRLGEMVSLDLAALNMTSAPLYVHALTRHVIQLSVTDESGKSIEVQFYSTSLEGMTPDNYTLLAPGAFAVNSMQVIAGGDRTQSRSWHRRRADARERTAEASEAAYFRHVFDNDLFVNWGEAWLNVDRPGTYQITATFYDDTVVTGAKRGTKTATGSVTSAPILIRIVP